MTRYADGRRSTAAFFRARRARAGLTLVEVALLFGLVGIVLAVVVPTFFRALQVSKLTEVSEQLEAMHRAAASYYAAPRTTAEGLRIECLPASAGPAPARPSADPVAVDFAADTTPGAETWRAIGFRPSVPLRYRYTLVSAVQGCGTARDVSGTVITFRAEGDLDADGILSRFERSAVHRDGSLAADKVALVHDRVE